MGKSFKMNARWGALLLPMIAGLVPKVADATIIGRVLTSGNVTVNLMAKADAISTGDGDSMWMWGYALCASTTTCPNRMQSPGPTVIVNQGANVTINLRNQLPVPTLIVFPGLNATVGTAVGGGGSNQGTPGILTGEIGAAAPNTTTGTVTYRFTASQPGTYIYYSGTQPDLQDEMGLAGTIIVRPTVGGVCAGANCTVIPNQAYGDASTYYDREYLFFLSDADPVIHQKVAFATQASPRTVPAIQARLTQIDMTQRHPTDWFINGRNFPDTLTFPNPPSLQTGYPTDRTLYPVASQFPTQPYNGWPQMHPGEKVLMRMVGAGADLHPLHTHGQNHVVIARDGRVLSTAVLTSGASAVADLGVSDYTTTSVPGETVDAVWGPWTGAKLGWDVYGTTDINPHTCTPDGSGFDLTSHEWCADHNKPLPVELADESTLAFGQLYGGSPYLGVPGALPPLNPDGTIHVDKNPLGGLSYMWHSHNERELTTNDIFIGGMATMALVLPIEGVAAVCPGAPGLSNPCHIW